MDFGIQKNLHIAEGKQLELHGDCVQRDEHPKLRKSRLLTDGPRTPNFGADHRVSRSSVAEDPGSRSAGVLAANNKLAGSSTSLDPAFLAMYEQPPFPLTSFHEN